MELSVAVKCLMFPLTYILKVLTFDKYLFIIRKTSGYVLKLISHFKYIYNGYFKVQIISISCSLSYVTCNVQRFTIFRYLQSKKDELFFSQ